MEKISCTGCFTVYSNLEDNFYKNYNKKNGHTSQCKQCIKDVRCGNDHLILKRINENIEATKKRRIAYLKSMELKEEKCEAIKNGIFNLKQKFYWNDLIVDWMDSKERIVLKTINNENLIKSDEKEI